jgi:chromosome segregation protein
MADVIFSGSSGRQPVGHATIELVFDNSDGKVGGQYANYNEIAVKRVVGRDGQSNYYLNNTRCRRKDITDIFLGTGLGPRSYAIIEQGMISRFIEAKPEEVRNFLEEAAGISKYKERRRETENRIRHTRDNIDRLNDILEELIKQLQKLDRQAKVAEKYKVLRQEERQLKAQLLALKWKSIDSQASDQRKVITDTETAYEAKIAEQRGIESDIEKKRAEHNDASDAFNKIQEDYYKVGAEIARIEQSIQHNRDKRQQVAADLTQIGQEINEAKASLEQDEMRLQELSDRLAIDEPAMEQAREVEKTAVDNLAGAEEAMQDWQMSWEEFNTEASKPSRTAEVERTRIQHLEQQLNHARERLAKLEKEHVNLAESHEQEIDQLQQQRDQARQRLASLEAEVADRQQRIGDQRDVVHELTEHLDDKRSELQSLKGRLSSLEALQEDALGKSEGTAVDWLEQRGLRNALRVAEGIQVEQGWEHAVETVLGFHLEAICVDNVDHIAHTLNTLEHGSISMLDTSASLNTTNGDLASPLSNYISAPWSLGGLLSGIYAVDDIDAALSIRPRLAANESVITRDGVWVGPNWIRAVRDGDANEGVLHRESEIKTLTAKIQQYESDVSELQRRLDDGKEQLRVLEEERDNKQAAVKEAGSQLTDLQSRLSAGEASLEQIRSQNERIKVDAGELNAQIERGEQALQESRQNLETATAAVQQYEREREELSGKRDNLRELLEQARERYNQDHDHAHQLEVRVESTRTALYSTRDAVERLQGRLSQLVNRQEELNSILADGEKPIQELESQRETLLSQRLQVEEQLNAARKAMEDIGHAVEQANQLRNETEQAAQDIRSELEAARMAFQGIDVRRQTLQEQIDQTGIQRDELLSSLPEDATEEQWQEDVEKMERRIERLGPINLAAIEEFGELSERKEYLDTQLEDLRQALETLENAIHKIDKETKERFKEIFDHVNEKLQEMFPRLFGGGNAHLEMESNDLLTSGVLLMARPPGKRLSSIQLMSGGEKALTAVALIFAIFTLNPAPFCMLDEVDAPLDDANVGRFCELVQSMSDQVQFIFITHNKLTMEIAQTLTGVTMHEPGVSRIVAVDLDEAAAMATG